MKFSTSLLLPFLAAASLVSAKNIAGIHKMKFDIKRGNNRLATEEFSSELARFVKRDDTVEVELENESSFYLADLSIGSNNQSIGVLIDTGSSDLWVMGTNNPFCQQSSSSSNSVLVDKILRQRHDNGVVLPGHARAVTTGGGIGGPPDVATTTEADQEFATLAVSSSEATIDCQKYGTFDEDSSTSYRSNNTDFLIQYADLTFAFGNWGRDDVTIGDVTVTGLSFATLNESNSTIGVLGIGLAGLETTYAGSLTNTNYQYANLPMKMVEQGLINKNVYSLFLDSASSDSGEILFGGVDHSKYSGSLTLLPIVNSLESSNFNSPIRLEITLSSISMLVSDDSSAIITSTVSTALLDSGTTLTYVPPLVMIKIGDALGATYSSSVGAYVMPCVDSDNSTTLDFDFSGAKISVPVSNLMISVSSFSNLCAVGTLSSGDNSFILGDSFLRAAYVVYDLDDLQIALAQANHDGGDEDIEVIRSSIPSAVSASSYSATWSTDASDSNTVLSFSSGSVRATATGSSGARSGSSSSSSRASAESSSFLSSFISSDSASSSATSTDSSSSASGGDRSSFAVKSHFNPITLIGALVATLVIMGL